MKAVSKLGEKYVERDWCLQGILQYFYLQLQKVVHGISYHTAKSEGRRGGGGREWRGGKRDSELL